MRMLHQLAAAVYVNVTSVGNCLHHISTSGNNQFVYVNDTSVSNSLWECYIS
jgi:hypothetical protein